MLAFCVVVAKFETHFHTFCFFVSETRLQTQSATQSSTVSGHLASYAIDNKLSTNLFVDDCAHTGGPGENFWQTELATYTAVRRVMLYLRSDFGAYFV